MRAVLGGAFDRVAGLLWRRERLFSYGTLQLEQVQLATFGRRLAGSADTLSGYRLGTVAIASDDVVAISGIATHPIVHATGNPLDLVAGMVFEVSPAELAQADAYEADDYQRVRVTLSSGLRAWVYAAALAAGAAQGLPIVQSSTQTYAVVGASESEVRASLDQAPLSPDGRRRAGYTEADVHWEFRYKESGGKCRVVSVKVTLTAKVTLPAWTPPYGASRALRDSWTRFHDALSRHEQGHVDIGYAAAKRIEDALWRAPTPKTCRGYDDALGTIANAIFDQAELDQKAYDARTDHGAAEGVRFP